MYDQNRPQQQLHGEGDDHDHSTESVNSPRPPAAATPTSSSSSSESIPNLQWFIMPETVLMTDTQLNITLTITPNTKTFNHSLVGQPFLKLVQDDEVPVIRELVKKIQIGDGSPVSENLIRNRFMNDVIYKISPVYDSSGHVEQYLIVRTVSASPKESPPTRSMERRHSGHKEKLEEVFTNPKLPAGNEKILSKFIKLVEDFDDTFTLAVWLVDRSSHSTLHLVAFPAVRELIGIKVHFNPKQLDRSQHDTHGMSIRSSQNYLQTPELLSKLQDKNFTTQFVSQIHTSQQFVGLLVLYGGDQFKLTPTLKSIVADATLLVESVISLEYDSQLSKRALEEQTLLDTTFGAGKGVTIIVNAQGHLLYVNSVVRDLFGIMKDEALHIKKIEHFVDLKDRHRVISAVTKSKQNPKLARYVDCVEFHRRAVNEDDPKADEESNNSDFENDSFYLDLKIQGLWDDPAVNGCLIRGRDVSAKAMSDRQALESQKSLAMTNNSLNEGLIRTDGDGIIEYVNLAFIKLIGIDDWFLSSKPRSNPSQPDPPEQLSSSSASDSTGTEDEDQNLALSSTLVGTPIDELLQLIQVLIAEKPQQTSSSANEGSATDDARTPTPKLQRRLQDNQQEEDSQEMRPSRSNSPVRPELHSNEAYNEGTSSTSTDDDMLDEGFSYKTVLVDMKAMIKQTIGSKESKSLEQTSYHQACGDDVYGDVLHQDMMEIINYQMADARLGRNVGYLIRRGGQTAVVAVEVSVNPLQHISYKRSKARAKSKSSDGAVIVFRNMTEVMRTQAANRMLADKSRWISVITHEMRSLVNGIIGMLDLVKATKLSGEQRGLVDCMEVSTNALICLVSNALDHSRLEAGKVALENLPFNMKERLRIVEDLMRMMAQTKHVEFSSEIDDSLPAVFHSDFNRLFQILLNLISNAIKFSSHKKKRNKQGKVKLIVKCMSEKDRTPGATDYPTPESPSQSQSQWKSRQRYKSMLSSDKNIDTQLTSTNSTNNTDTPLTPPGPGELLTIPVNQRMTQLMFIVEDNGIGISPRSQEKLFQEFGQAEVSISRRYGGSGMGLFICKQLVRLFNGTIGVQSTPGEGSQFWFTAWFNTSEEASATPGSDNNNYFSMEQALIVNNNYDGESSSSQVNESGSESATNDASSSEASDSTSHIDLPPPPKTKKTPKKKDLRILVVEDNRINQQVLYKFCQGLGYHHVQVVGDGRSAVKKCSKHTFDVILMDMSMPRMNGMDATEAIREQPKKQQPAIVLISGDSNIDHTRYQELKFDGHLVKPIRMPELKRELEKY
ncbi:hypothetical protein INT43_009130 [Umbelopsis isabellina]|uniref:histidine kinase n=1 Tax=Mortierella isabellina TaxID=91625 RepID=A0A8H7PD45_MORIS|nr:hypothetical protein INT43_009130 [Umbelopsis isabellina]